VLHRTLQRPGSISSIALLEYRLIPVDQVVIEGKVRICWSLRAGITLVRIRTGFVPISRVGHG
jgi:hypothetical protein